MLDLISWASHLHTKLRMLKHNTSITDFLLWMMCVCVHIGVCELGGHVPATAHVWKPEEDNSCQVYFGPFLRQGGLLFHCSHQLACVWRFLCPSLPHPCSCRMLLLQTLPFPVTWVLRIWIQDLRTTWQRTFTPRAISTEKPPYHYFSPHTGNNICRKTL